jgi:predicted  nucleic acid-binding Zn-ribbon protein
MQETLAALRALQELDQEIFRLRAELKRLPEERAQRRAQIDAAIQRRETAAKAARELKTRLKEIEDDTTVQRQRIRKIEHEASNSRGDMALLAAYQHEIRTLKRSVSEAEEQGVGLVEQIDAAQAELERMQKEIDAAEGVFAQFVKNAENETAKANEKLETLLARRKQRVSTAVTPESMALYERLLAARTGVALAELDGRVCQACYIEVPTNLYVRVARGAALTQCPSCDRILYLRDA